LYFYPYFTMNILILTFQGDIAGSTYSISYLSKGLAEKGHQVFVGCRKESLLFQLLEESNVTLIPMTFKGRFDLGNMRQIKNVVNQYAIQVVNAQSSYDRYTSVFSKWLYGLKVKIVHTRRQISKSMGGPVLNLVFVKGTDKIVAVSEGVKVSLVKTGIPEKHIEIIYNGTPREKYDNIDHQLTEQLKLKYNLRPDDFVIGCVSRLKSQKQILQALGLLNFKVKMIFVGIDKQSGWEEIMKRYPVKHEVHFAGLVDKGQILAYYGLFNIKILASTMEGLSQSLLEAMALGVPVVATNASGNPELIGHGENGFLFEDGDIEELADEINQLYKNRDLRDKFSTNGRQTALDTFNIDHTIENFEKLFRKLIES